MIEKASEVYYVHDLVGGVKVAPNLHMHKMIPYLKEKGGLLAGCKRGKQINSEYYHYKGCTVVIDECFRESKLFSGGLSVFHDDLKHAKEVLGELEKFLLS